MIVKSNVLIERGDVASDTVESLSKRIRLDNEPWLVGTKQSVLVHDTQPTSSTISVIPFSSNTVEPDPDQSHELTVSMNDVIFHSESTSDMSEDILLQQNIIETSYDINNVDGVPNEELCIGESENYSLNVQEDSRNINISKSIKRFASSELKFRCFQINWSKISDVVLNRLQDLQKFRYENPNQCAPRSLQLSKSDWSGVTNSVVDQLRTIDTEIQASVMEKVAKAILDKYPCLNFLDDDGFDTGTGYVWIKHKMLNRNSYLNRFKKEDDEPTLTTICFRQCRNVRAGTNKEYWESSSKHCSKDVLSTLARNEPEVLTTDFLHNSQSYVRYRFDEDKSLKDILADFPVLRRRRVLNFHFECATGVSINSLAQYFALKKSKLINYSNVVRKSTRLDTTATDVDIFKFLCNLLGEKFEDVVIFKEIGTKIDGISIDCSGPVLVAVDCGNERRIFYVFAEQVRLSEGTESFITAISDLLSVHYVHNFMYMRQISKFLEFVQQYFFKIIPSTGSKSNATRKNNQQRVVKNVIKSISEFCAPLREINLNDK
ncbi:uncharacterized protein LOC131429271 [Malaya genurostris]|uniref:uncharacterized protein LOC131429271 n=1 Tax=Malaya genurostris TaxID=325434 RepID=UPI0026F3E2AB|nr:uncharacterized protein LOC131429271 [Malaya genurostris]